MKKMISMVCAMLMAVTTFGATCTPAETVTSCEQWFKTHGQGKIACAVTSGSYAENQKLKFTDCYIVNGVDETVIVLTGSAGKNKFTKELVCSEFTWRIYGKKLATLLETNKKMSDKVDSSIEFVAASEDGTTEVRGVLFGTVTCKKTKGSACEAGDLSYSPNTFNGYFVGSAAPECSCALVLTSVLACRDGETEGVCGPVATTFRDCLSFEEGEEKVVFGGTMSAKWSEKKSGCIAR